jgi:AcrR family transcriptional regulator
MTRVAALPTRGERRRRATEARLLDAALQVFLARGYDAATTGEMARVADVAAGTFYLHFRDKRAAYERLARDAARELLDGWRAAMRPGMPMAERVTLGLRLAADYWRADVRRARLLLEHGPALGSENHVRLVDEIGTLLAAAGSSRPAAPVRALGLLSVGLAIEVGRLVAGRPEDPTAEVDDLLRLVRRSLAYLDVVPGRRADAKPRP